MPLSGRSTARYPLCGAGGESGRDGEGNRNGASTCLGSVNDDAGARSPRRWTWARLLRRVFAIEVLVCARCGGPRRILGAVTEPPAVWRVLVALGLAAEPPPGPAVPAT